MMTKIDWAENRIAWGLLTEEEQADFSAAPGDVIFYAGSDRWERKDLDAYFTTYTYRKIPAVKTKPRVPWDALSDDVVAVARKASGACYAYLKTVPYISEVAGVWTTREVNGCYRIFTETLRDFDPGTCDWFNSLVLRPGYEERDQ